MARSRLRKRAQKRRPVNSEANLVENRSLGVIRQMLVERFGRGLVEMPV